MRREENPQAKKITALIVNSRISQREQDMVVMEVEDTDLPMGFLARKNKINSINQVSNKSTWVMKMSKLIKLISLSQKQYRSIWGRTL